MQEVEPPTLDMAPDGSFQEVPPWPGLPRGALGWRTRLLVAALGVSFVTGLIAVLAISLYIVLIAVPIMLALAAYAFLAARVRLWRHSMRK